MYARIESIIPGILEKWPHLYQDQARTRLKGFLDSLLAEERKQEDARLMLDIFEDTHPEYTKSENFKQQVRVVSSGFERLGFFQRLWRYFTTNIVRMLTLNRLSALKAFREGLDKESIFSDAALKSYESDLEEQSWFTRLIMPSVPGLKQAIKEMKQEHSQNTETSEKASEEMRDARTGAIRWVNTFIEETFPLLFRLEKELEHLNRLLAWDVRGIQPKVPELINVLEFNKKKEVFEQKWLKLSESHVKAMFLQDADDVKPKKVDLALSGIYGFKRDYFFTKNTIALERIKELEVKIEEKKRQVASHLNACQIRKNLDDLVDTVRNHERSLFRNQSVSSEFQSSSESSKESSPPPRSLFSS